MTTPSYDGDHECPAGDPVACDPCGSVNGGVTFCDVCGIDYCEDCEEIHAAMHAEVARVQRGIDLDQPGPAIDLSDGQIHEGIISSTGATVWLT